MVNTTRSFMKKLCMIAVLSLHISAHGCFRQMLRQTGYKPLGQLYPLVTKSVRNKIASDSTLAHKEIFINPAQCSTRVLRGYALFATRQGMSYAPFSVRNGKRPVFKPANLPECLKKYNQAIR